MYSIWKRPMRWSPDQTYVVLSDIFQIISGEGVVWAEAYLMSPSLKECWRNSIIQKKSDEWFSVSGYLGQLTDARSKFQ